MFHTPNFHCQKCKTSHYLQKTVRVVNGVEYKRLLCLDCANKVTKQNVNVRAIGSNALLCSVMYGIPLDIIKNDIAEKLNTAGKKSWIKRYGEVEGLKKYEEYRKKQAYAGCALEYFIEKYGEEAGRLKYKEVNKNKALTLSKFTSKYGEKLGEIKYNEWLENNRKHRKDNFKSYSDISQVLFKKLDELFPSNNFNYATKNFEHTFNLDNHHYVSVDFYDIDTNTVIEFFGTYWHADPRKYDSEFYIFQKQAYKARDVWTKDIERILYLQLTYNVKVLIVWEMDWLNNPEMILEQCKKVLQYETPNRNSNQC